MEGRYGIREGVEESSSTGVAAFNSSTLQLNPLIFGQSPSDQSHSWRSPRTVRCRAGRGSRASRAARSTQRLVDNCVEQCAELVVLPVEAAYVGGEATLVIEMLPGDVTPCLPGELAQERAQTACVALAEWVHRVHLGVVMRQSLQEGGAIEAFQTVLPGKLGEDALRIARNVLGASVEHALGFAIWTVRSSPAHG